MKKRWVNLTTQNKRANNQKNPTTMHGKLYYKLNQKTNWEKYLQYIRQKTNLPIKSS